MNYADLEALPPEEWPFKLRVLHAITDVLKEITPDNGFTFNLADFDPGDASPMARVFRGRPWFGESDILPFVSVLEAPTGSDEVYMNEYESDDTSGEHDWPLLVQGFLEDNPQHPTDPAYWLMRDVRRRLLQEKRRLKPGSRGTTDPFGTSAFGIEGCAVTGLKVSSGIVRPADDVSAKTYFWVLLTLRIVETEAP